jgi:hypothetical protein
MVTIEVFGAVEDMHDDQPLYRAQADNYLGACVKLTSDYRQMLEDNDVPGFDCPPSKIIEYFVDAVGHQVRII